MHLDLVASAEQVTPQLLAAASAGTGNRALFMQALEAHGNALSGGDWLMLFITLRALVATPEAAQPVRTAPAPAASPAAHVPGQGAQQ